MQLDSLQKFKIINLIKSPAPWESRTGESIPRGLLYWLILIFLVKLILISQDEMIAVYTPHDDLWQIRAASQMYWGGVSYSPENLYHLSIFPIFIKLIQLIGLPLRIALEVLYCGAAAYISTTFWRMGSKQIFAGLMSTAIILHPSSFQLPNRCGAEILLAPLLIYATAATLRWWIHLPQPKSNKYAVSAALLWALSWNVRKESIVLIPVFAAIIIFPVIVYRKKWYREITIGLALMVCSGIVMEAIIKTVNWTRWGIYATSLHTGNGFQHAVKSLQSIAPETPLDYIPVSVEVRNIAYEISPTFKKLRPYLEGQIAKNWAYHSKPFTDSKGMSNLKENEISAGWFYWALYDSVVAAGYGMNAGKADDLFEQIGDEIDSAISKGLVKSRLVMIPMVDPEFSRWLHRIPDSFIRVFKTFLNTNISLFPKYDPVAEEMCGDEFDRIANRRAYLKEIRFGKGEIKGWIKSNANLVVNSVEVKTTKGTLWGRAPLDVHRPDVDSHRISGFRLSLNVPANNTIQSSNILVKFSNGKYLQCPINLLIPGQVIRLPFENPIVSLGIDAVKLPEFKQNNLLKMQSQISKYYNIFQSWLIVPSVACGFFFLVSLLKQRAPIDFAILIIGVTVVSRIIFFTILDACAWPGDQPRYLYPVHSLFVMLIGLLLLRTSSYFSLFISDNNALFNLFRKWKLVRNHFSIKDKSQDYA